MDQHRNPGHARLIKRQTTARPAQTVQDAGIAGIVASAVGSTVPTNKSALPTTSRASTATPTSKAGSGSSTSPPASASPSSAALTATNTSSNTGTIVGVVVAVVVVVALIAGFFGYRKWKNRSSRGSGSPLIKSNISRGFRKQDEDDAVFGNSASNQDFVSGSGGYSGEKPSDAYGATGMTHSQSMGTTGPGMAGMGAGREYQQREQQSQEQYGGQQGRWDATSPSGMSSPTTITYPPPSATSSTGLLDGQGKRSLEEQQGRTSPAAQGLATIDERDSQREATKSPFADSPGQGKVHVVKRTFEPSLEDELIIFPGDRIQVLMSYDDGWALGINLDAPTPGTKGVFPFDCLDDPASAQAEAPNQQALDAASSTTAFSQPPQLAPLRTDSPLSTHFPHNAQQQPQPTISISQPSSRSIFDQSQGQSKMTSSTSADNISSVARNGNGKLDARGNRQGEKNKRASSLIASRDANLFVALGEALGKDDQRF